MKKLTLLALLIGIFGILKAQEKGKLKYNTHLKNVSTKEKELKVEKREILDIVGEDGIYYIVDFKGNEYIVPKKNVEVLDEDELPVHLPIDDNTGKITYSDVVIVKDLSKNELYSRAREWFATTYNSSINVIQMEDPANGKLIGRALFDVYHKGLGMLFDSGNIKYSISIFFKNGRYKYIITDFVHQENLSNGGRKTSCEDLMHEKKRLKKKITDFYLRQLDENMKILIADLSDFMQKERNINSGDDW